MTSCWTPPPRGHKYNRNLPSFFTPDSQGISMCRAQISMHSAALDLIENSLDYLNANPFFGNMLLEEALVSAGGGVGIAYFNMATWGVTGGKTLEV